MPTRDTSLWTRALAERAALLARLDDALLGAQVMALADLVTETLQSGGKILLFGNGGSAALAQHAAAELVGRFEKERVAQAAVALTTDMSIVTAVSNDYGYDRIFERQIEGLARRGDLAVALSTSGKSLNVVRGLKAAARAGAHTAALLGQSGGPARSLARHAIVIPATRVSLIQEAHEIIVHVLCEAVDEQMARGRSGWRRTRAARA